jgi:phosphatidylglycerophosphate synthase
MLQADTGRTALLTLPNLLSLSRVALIAPLSWAIIKGEGLIAVVLFAFVIVTDFLDGLIARRAHQVTEFGTLLDHGCDALFVSAIAGLLAYLGLLPLVLPLLIAIAFLQYSLDSRVLEGARLRPSRIGRWNGVAYFVIVGAGIVVHHFAADPMLLFGLWLCGWVVVATTVISIAERAVYMLRARSGA